MAPLPFCVRGRTARVHALHRKRHVHRDRGCAMEFQTLMHRCTSITCSDFVREWLPFAAVYGLVLGIGIVRMAARRKASLLLDLSGRRSR